MIDEELARTSFPNEDPIGQRIHLDLINADYEVVGIVGHVRHWGLERDNLEKIRSQVYIPFRQTARRHHAGRGERLRVGRADVGRRWRDDRTDQARRLRRATPT